MPSAPALAPDELLVGSERGLEIVAADGTLKRTVSAGPALHPRWLDASSVLVVVPKDDTTKTGLVYPVVHPEGPWPAPLSGVGKSHRVRTPIEQTL